MLQLDPLLDLPYFKGAETAGTIEAAVLGAEKGCDWIKQCLDYYEGRKFVRENGMRRHPDAARDHAGADSAPETHREGRGRPEALKRKDLSSGLYPAAGLLLAEGLRLAQGDAHARHLRHPPLPEFVVSPKAFAYQCTRLS
ncbi:MAG: hypothetical protein ACLUYV_05160 [Alistipes shahii]